MEVWILRLGHRMKRDERISTHCGLVARAFNANGIVYSGEKDDGLLNSIKRVVERFGGPFEVKYEKNWRKVIKEWKGKILHLTMYGLPVQEKIEEIKNCKENLLIVIGGEKVPGEVYSLADWNIAITNQPHSEVAALAIFLHELFEGKEFEKEFKGKVKIIPQEKGKKVISL
jgi:tRNA (cytidine56-2'-O)-methyltransferase